MSMFGNLMAKVFGAKHPAAEAAALTVASAEVAASQPQSAAAAEATAAAVAAVAAAAAEPVDVEAVLDDMNEKHPEELDWKSSIVDLMKLVGMDSSLTARKQLAHELQYSGDTGDSASMNMWLHKQVMTKIAENGGKLPAGLQR